MKSIMHKKINIRVATISVGMTLAFLFPLVVFAQNFIRSAPVTSSLNAIIQILRAAFPVIIGFAIALFLWGLMKYMLSADNVEERTKSRSFMLWGVVIIFVMVSLWGLVNLLGDVFSLRNNAVPRAPRIPR